MSHNFVEIEETDYGSKGRAIQASKNLPEAINAECKWRLRYWWEMVLETARALCPVDTGTLQASLRIEDKTVEFGSFFEKAFRPQDNLIDSAIVAGGILINPKTGRICDYAQAVHDGHFTRSGRWIPPTPFIEMAVQIHTPELNTILSKSLDRAINITWVGE